MAERILFVDRDGTILEEPEDYQVDDFKKMRFVEGVLPALKALKDAGWKLVMVSNQDGLGTSSFPTETFEGPHNLMMQILESQGAKFDEVLICPHMPGDGCACRKPGTGLVKKYLRRGAMDRKNSYVIGDRETDLKLAENMGLAGIRVGPEGEPWRAVEARLLASLPQTPKTDRHAVVERKTKETDIRVEVWLDREVDCHHTVEDTGLALGEAIRLALGDKRGIRRFGFLLPMDEALCRVALDISGRPWLTFKAKFKNQFVGDLATEMIEHFFRSFSQAMGITLNMKAKGKNDHHVAESLFKALGRTLRDAKRIEGHELPSSKGVL